MIKKSFLFPVAALALLLSCNPAEEPVLPDEEPDRAVYLPDPDHVALIFTHKFHPDDYEAGKQIVIEQFSQAIEASGHTRRTYFLSREDSAEVVTLSFFHPNSSTSLWLSSPGREEVLSTLRSMFRAPLDVQEYTAEHIHNTHVTDDLEPEYHPEPGHELVLFIHWFKPESYASGKDLLTNGFPEDMENSGETRRSYFLDRPEDYKVVVASFVHPDSDAELWLDEEERRETLGALSPLYREPLQVARYIVQTVHNTGSE